MIDDKSFPKAIVEPCNDPAYPDIKYTVDDGFAFYKCVNAEHAEETRQALDDFAEKMKAIYNKYNPSEKDWCNVHLH